MGKDIISDDDMKFSSNNQRKIFSDGIWKWLLIYLTFTLRSSVSCSLYLALIYLVTLPWKLVSLERCEKILILTLIWSLP